MSPFRLRLPRWIVLGLLLAAAAVTSAAQEPLHHELRVRLEPVSHEIEVIDRITFPAAWSSEQDGLRFLLHAGLEPTASGDATLEELGAPDDLARYGINSEGPEQDRVPLREYRLTGRDGDGDRFTVELSYGGTLHHPLVTEGEEYARSFSRTPGIIDEQGVVLSGSSYWLPVFGQSLATFRMEVDLPEDWDAVSQGDRARHETAAGRRHVTWDSPQPMDEAYLIAARFTEYSRPAGNVTAYVFLREPEPNLAAKYLEATVQYVEMYRQLIGTYPYGKFALVENFWDTGYGMPSFTLLGSRIIRFPFILHSSYPHEILHNWWGNSVFVDYESGNWCEGLTAYLADHLIKEGQGRGVDYRRDTLKKYRSFVRGEKDFPLTEFRSRHSSATEAVGYGKSLMLWHMLRRLTGDETFADALRDFYRGNRFRRASFGDLEAAFAESSGEELGWFFRQWVERVGAPELALESVRSTPADGGGTHLSIELRQRQAGTPYRLSVPVAISLAGEDAARVELLEMDGRTGRLELDLPAPATRVDVDPQFDLFRRVDPLEIPASVGQLFGAERVIFVLPGEDDPLGTEEWARFARSWAEDDETLEIVSERDLAELPRDRAVWILGSGNRWRRAVDRLLAPFGAEVAEDALRTGQGEHARDGLSFAFAVRHPDDPDLAVGWIGADRPAALPGLGRKLPHYGKYSYVAFTGDEPTNVAKGQWPVLGSPLVHLVDTAATTAGALPAREPLARPEPVFDPARMVARVHDLTDPKMEGRGVGTDGLVLAEEYVARAFEQAGLTPGGDEGGWYQAWTEPDGPDGRTVTIRNVIGVLRGDRQEWQRQSVVLGAHIDHLGRGWPDVRSGEEGKIHPGADDNASGVAVLLELADLLGAELKPDRSIVFVAFGAEEWQLRGSRHYVAQTKDRSASDAIAMVNLDTVGRLHDGKITVLGTGSATEWVHIVRGIGFTTGIEGQSVADDLGGSDQKSFLDAGIPAVQLFTGARDDYHSPRDVAGAIDATGLVRVAAFTREMIVYLSEREEPMTSTLSTTAAGAAPSPAPARGGRRVSLGTLPEFTFPGPGVKIERVLPGTPAEKAGLKPGDLIVAIDGEEIADVRAYAAVLRAHEPGETIRIRLLRDEAELTVEATLVAR